VVANVMLRFFKSQILVMSGVLLLVLSVWEWFSSHHEMLQFVLPSPSTISYSLWEHADRFRFHTFATFKEMMGGVLIAFIVAFPLAWLMAHYGALRGAFQTVFVITQCVPMFALAPLMVLWFGWSYTAILVPTALMIFFPLAMNIYQGICATPKHLLDFFKLHQATPWQVFFKLQLPWGLPHIFAGLRIALAFAGIGAVAGEWAGAQEGLGILMLESRRAADIEMMFGALVCLTVLSLVFYAGAIFLEKLMINYQRRDFF
jgi:NitT/TauT family transport system substrate-binding protein